MNKTTIGILFVIPWELSFPGGVNQVVLNLLNQSSSRSNLTPILLVNTWGQLRPSITEENGILVIRLRLPFIDLSSGIKSKITSLISCYILKKILLKYSIKIVNVHYPSLSSTVFIKIQEEIKDLRIILSFHGTDVDQVNSAYHKHDEWRNLLSLADKVVFSSENLREKLNRSLRVNWANELVIGNGINPCVIDKELNQARTIKQLENVEYIVNVGSFERIKGQDQLISAFCRIEASMQKLKLVLVGRSGEELANYKKLVSENNLDKKVIFLQDLSHADTMRVISDSTVFVLSSREESFGIVLLEAGYLGVPIVAMDVGGVSNVLENGNSGRLVEAGSIESLERNIMYALKRNSDTERLAHRMKAQVNLRYTWDKIFREYETDERVIYGPPRIARQNLLFDKKNNAPIYPAFK